MAAPTTAEHSLTCFGVFPYSAQPEAEVINESRSISAAERVSQSVKKARMCSGLPGFSTLQKNCEGDCEDANGMPSELSQ